MNRNETSDQKAKSVMNALSGAPQEWPELFAFYKRGVGWAGVPGLYASSSSQTQATTRDGINATIVKLRIGTMRSATPLEELLVANLMTRETYTIDEFIAEYGSKAMKRKRRQGQ